MCIIIVCIYGSNVNGNSNRGSGLPCDRVFGGNDGAEFSHSIETKKIAGRLGAGKGDYVIFVEQKGSGAVPQLSKVHSVYQVNEGRVKVWKANIETVAEPGKVFRVNLKAITTNSSAHVNFRGEFIPGRDDIEIGAPTIIMYQGLPEIVIVEWISPQKDSLTVRLTKDLSRIITDVPIDLVVHDPRGHFRKTPVTGRIFSAYWRYFHDDRINNVRFQKLLDEYYNVRPERVDVAKGDAILRKTLFTKSPIDTLEFFGKDAAEVARLKARYGKDSLLPAVDVSAIKKAGLYPKHKMTYKGVNYYFSDAYNVKSDGRIALVCFVELQDGRVFARSVYQSHSHVSWQVASYINAKKYGKGTINPNEERFRDELESSVRLPIALHRWIYEIAENPISVEEKLARHIFYGIAGFGYEWSASRSERERPKSIASFGSMVAEKHGKPETATFKKETNFAYYNIVVDRFTVSKELYGGPVELVIHASIDGELLFVFARTKHNMVWNDIIESTDARVTRWGAVTPPVADDDLVIPLFTHASEIPDGYRARDNSVVHPDYSWEYKSAFPYVSKLPTTVGFCQAHGIRMPDIQ